MLIKQILDAIHLLPGFQAPHLALARSLKVASAAHRPSGPKSAPILLLLGTLIWLLASATAHAQSDDVLPKPLFAPYGPTQHQSPKFSIAATSDAFAQERKAFQEDWPELQSPVGRKIVIEAEPALQPEEYWLSLGKSAILRVGSPVAAAWALQTLGSLASERIDQARIHDKPDYAFRGVMVDVARRFHSLSTLRQIVRWCQAGKVRFIQLHLTDDQNWMLPTYVLAGIDRNNSSGHPAYTVEEIRDLRSFAQARGVSVIPELDIPGHSTLLVKLNPAVFAIQGSASTNCINFGSSKVRAIMRELIQETANLFSDSPYIHLGGDEAWYPDAEKDPEIARRLSSIGAKATAQDVFVDFVAEMAETVIAQGKTPIVWEGFGPTAYSKKRIPLKTVVVAWDGSYYPAKDLVADGFGVVNAGWDPYYVVNHYPYDSYTLVPLPTLFRLDPQVFSTVDRSPGTSGAVSLHPNGNLLGAMMCWWEGYEWNAQTTLPLRILALGARLWNRAGERDYPDFLRRSKAILERIHVRTVPFKVTTEGARPGNPLEFTSRVTVKPKSSDRTLSFGIRTDGAVPSQNDMKRELQVENSSVITIQAFRGSNRVGETEFVSLKKVTVLDNLALGAHVTGSTQEDPQFPASLVTDGVSDDVGAFWLGYPNPCSLTIDLGACKLLNRVDVAPFWAAHQPTQYAVDLSTDGVAWIQVVDATKQTDPPTEAGTIHRFPVRKARYIRVRITGSQQFPPTMARIQEVRAYLER